MSIFNIGSRFHDPLKRHKHSAKGIMHCWCVPFVSLHSKLKHCCTVSEKDRDVLRPARSMDSLSTPSYPNEGAFIYFLTFLLYRQRDFTQP